MKRSAWLQLCLIGSIVAVGVAVAIKMTRDPGGPMGDSLVMISPVFFTVAARKATRFPKMAVALGTLGLLFSAGALAAVLSSGGG